MDNYRDHLLVLDESVHDNINAKAAYGPNAYRDLAFLKKHNASGSLSYSDSSNFPKGRIKERTVTTIPIKKGDASKIVAGLKHSLKQPTGFAKPGTTFADMINNGIKSQDPSRINRKSALQHRLNKKYPPGYGWAAK